ncbi:hypothetical protein BFW01_g850 [Lasiodiplodia theobromae]|uniref:Uncharacterized protein n=1 Tax=Lasiodiplodia theobromae TaxID=45133 RepID=A0A8H7IQW1_9PEZI|nr:hypothetical protein BFW01_g850 [Lasiodiplodia theobromae]
MSPFESVPHVHVHGREPPLDQLVKEPVLIGWRDPMNGQYQHVGCPQDSGQSNRGNLVMWIGRASIHNSQRLLINFCLPFSTRSTLHRSKKEMFLVVPAERLHMDLRRVDADGLPEATLSQLKGAGPAALREGLLQARFSLSNPAYVVMPKLRRPLATPLTGVPSRLMSSMRSLSGVREFDVYLSRGTVELELQVIRSMLNQGDVETPELDLNATFSGGFGGGKNLWQSYPCEEKDNSSWNPLIDNDPPSYEKMAMHADVHADPCAILKETRQRLCKKPASENLSGGVLNRVRPSAETVPTRNLEPETKRIPGMHGHKRKVSEAISDYEKQHLGKRDSGETTPEKVKEAPAPAQRIAPTHQKPAGPQPYRHSSGPAAPYNIPLAGKSKTVNELERYKELSISRSAAAAGPNTTAPAPPAHKTAYHNRATSNPLPQATKSAPLPPLPTPPPSATADHQDTSSTPLHLRAAVIECLHARDAHSSLSDPAPLHTPHLFLELAEFLATASRIDPHAHETHSALLLALGAAAREGDVGTFDANMRLCQQRVLRDAWELRGRGRGGRGGREDVAEELLGECLALLDWLNGSVCRIAGTVMMGMLVGLGAGLMAQAQAFGGMGGDAEERARREWAENLAKVRAAAFWAFG